MPLLDLQHVTKRFDGHTAVSDLSMQVPAGGIFGLLGPNGAGKSTTIRMIMNIIVPDAGTVTVFGEPASRDLSPRVGFLPEERGLYKKMRVDEHLIFLGETKGLTRSDARQRTAGWLDRLGLDEWAAKNVEDLSKGMQQKVQFVGALLHDPEFVVLDEPFSGLDPVNARVLKETVVSIARDGRTVLFSTHIMEQAEQMCDRIVIIARGEKVLDGAVRDIKRAAGTGHIRLSVTRNRPAAERVLADRSLVSASHDHGASTEASLAAGAESDQLLQALVGADVGMSEFAVVEPSLESIFISTVGEDAAQAARSEADDA